MKTAMAILVVALAFAVGAVVFVLSRESDKNADPNRVVTQVDPGSSAPGDDARLPARKVAVVAALAALPGDDVRVGELRSGTVRDVTGRTGRLGLQVGGPVARVAVSSGGQRGLLGLAVDRDGTTYAASTDRTPARRIVVDRLSAGGPPHRVWTGPRSATLANGGHLALAPDGRLVIGIGDLGRRDRLTDPRYPNGKLLSLATGGPATQRPRVLSGGWNNPYAFAFTPDGTLWVADNAPGAQPERLGRGDGDGPRTPLGRKTAPSGLVALDDRTLAVCGVVSHRLDRYVIQDDGTTRFGGTIADGCTFGVVRRTDGSLVVSSDSGLGVVQP